MRKLNLNLALEIASEVITRAERSSSEDDDPITVSIVGSNGKRIVTLAMDGVIPASVELSFSKAYTSWSIRMNTVDLEKREFKAPDFTDPNFTCLGGGVPLKDEHGKVYGAIGVSGRCSHQMDKDKMSPYQDHELALLGFKYWKKRTNP